MSTDSQQRMSIYLLIVLRMFIHSLILLFNKHIFNKLRSIVSQCKVYYTLVPKEEDIQREYTE